MIKLTATAVAAVLALNTYLFYIIDPTDVIPPRRAFTELPLTLGDWRCPGIESIGEAVEKNLGVTDYLNCNYWRGNGGLPVNVYVGYHERQIRHGAQANAESAIHPPRHCLPGSGWQIIEHRVIPVGIEGVELFSTNELVIAKGEFRQLVYYWYQERGRTIASDYWKIVYDFWDRATRSRSDGSLVRFTTPIERGQLEAAQERILGIAGEILPRLPDYVPD